MHLRGRLRSDRILCAAAITSHFPRRQAAWSQHPNGMRLIEKNVRVSYETVNRVSIKIFGVVKTETHGEKRTRETYGLTI